MKRILSFFVTPFIRLILRVICRIDAAELETLPGKGPYIIVMNHVNFLEVPVIYTFLSSRNPSSLVKEETWKNPFLGFLGHIWNAIPLKRGVADFGAFKAAEQVLKSGGILIIAPEGTRSLDGILRKGHPGAAFLAMRNRVPIYPAVHFGGEGFFEKLKRFKRTRLQWRVGAPFVVIPEKGGHLHQKITDEIMGRIASLLPEAQRGIYAEEALAVPTHLRLCGAKDV